MNAAIVAIANDTDPAAVADRFLNHGDPALRSAAEAAAAMLAGLGSDPGEDPKGE